MPVTKEESFRNSVVKFLGPYVRWFFVLLVLFILGAMTLVASSFFYFSGKDECDPGYGSKEFCTWLSKDHPDIGKTLILKQPVLLDEPRFDAFYLNKNILSFSGSNESEKTFREGDNFRIVGKFRVEERDRSLKIPVIEYFYIVEKETKIYSLRFWYHSKDQLFEIIDE